MNLLRRRMMMETQKSGAKYPLVNGMKNFSSGIGFVEVTNGNHVVFRKSEHGSAFINISNIFQNGNYQSSDSNINLMPEIYTIPSGVPIKFEVKNVNGVSGFDGETNFRLADSRVSGSFHTGRFDAANPGFNTVVETTLDIPEKIGCLFLYSAMSVGMQIEFDVTLTVNGERWI